MLSPIKFFRANICIYVLITAIYFFGPIAYPPLSVNGFLYAAMAYFFIWIGIKSNSGSKYLYFTKKKLAYNTEIIILILAISSILLSLVKYYNEGILFSGIDSIISNRLDKSFTGAEKGASIYGVLGNLLNGFVFIYYAYSRWKTKNSNDKFKNFPSLLLLLSAIVSVYGGGRFGIIIHLLFYFIINSLLKVRRQTKINFMILTIIFLSFLFIIYSFILKLQIHDSNLLEAFIFSTGFQIKNSYANLIGDNLSGLISVIFYYISHSLYQFNFFLDNYSGVPQLGAYQFYTFVILLNKVSFINITPIEEILLLLPKSGVYSTAFSAMIVDLGYFFSLFGFYIIGFFYSSSFYNYIKRNSFLGLFVFTILSINILFIPILSMIGTSIFPSIILTIIIYCLLSFASK